MESSEDASGLRGLVLLETGDHDCQVLDGDGSGLRLSLPTGVNLGKTIRLSFQRRGKVRVLGIVEGTQPMGDTQEVQVSLVALHSTDGMLYLEDFLCSVLQLTRPDPAAYQAGHSGYYYRFPRPTRDTAAERSFQRTGGPDTGTERREPRIAVRVTVSYRIGREDRVEAQAYNVSSNGIYLLSDTLLPGIGTPIEVDYPIPLHDRPLNALLVGEVVWAMDSMSSGQGGGLGIRMSRIEDGAGGAAWKQYVQREASFDDSLPLSNL